MSVIKFILQARVRTLKFLHNRRKEVQWVTLYVVRKDVTSREHQHLLVLLKLPFNVSGTTKSTVHTGIIMLSKEVWDVLIDKVRHGSHLLQVHL